MDDTSRHSARTRPLSRTSPDSASTDAMSPENKSAMNGEKSRASYPQVAMMSIRPAKKRKVQWADEGEAAPLDTLQDPGSVKLETTMDEPGPPPSTQAEMYVDEKGMLQRVSDAKQEDENQAHASEGDAESSKPKDKQYLQSEIYNPIEYGDFRSYMKHKRAKLKIQEASLLEEEEALLRVGNEAKDRAAVTDAELEAMGGKRSDVFKGCCVYINGQTHPPYSELRRLLVLHGGDLMAYLDQKTPVTHIVASNLTPKKRIEFKDYKVVLPGWILESIELGKRADWRKWRCDASTGSNGHTLDNMIAKPVHGTVAQNTNQLGQWRNLDHAAKMPRPLPRIGDEDESPWGKPSNQTTLLQGFPRAKPSSLRQDLPQCSAHQPDEALPVLQPIPHPTSKVTESEPSRSRSPSTAKQAPSALKHKSDRAEKRSVRFMETEADKPIRDTSAKLNSDSNGGEFGADDAEILKQAEDDDSTTSKDGHPGERLSVAGHDRSQQIDPATTTPTKKLDNRAMIDYTIGTDPASKKAAVAAQKTFYASRPSNTHAARLLASPSWRERNTATSEGFLAGYFAKSRLHHLSTWKTSLQDMVSSALREAGRPLGSSDLPAGVSRVIMHIDFDSFFVAVGLKSRPDLANKPVVVCHGTGHGLPPAKSGDENRPADNQSSSTSEIASCSYKAREYGIRNGMSLGQAKRLCPEVETIPYNFEAYNSISLTFYTFLMEHSDALQAVSVDEALVDVSLLLQSMRTGECQAGSIYDRYRDHVSSQGDDWTAEKQLAEAFRDEIRERCGCEASIGIGSNILLARLATRKAKPGGSFHLTDDVKQDFLNELDVDDLHGIGWSLRDRLREMFDTINIGAILAKTNERKLVAEFGPKKGKTIWDKMHGVDADRLEGNKLRQSVGSHVNYGIRFLTDQEAEAFVDGMCQEVSQRAKAVKLRGRQVSVQIMVRAKDAPLEAPKFLGHGVCDTHHRSVQVSGPGGVAIDDDKRIKAAAWPLIQDLKADPKELRGIAISLNKLEPAEGHPISPPKPQAGQSLLNFGRAKTIRPPHTDVQESLTSMEAHVEAKDLQDEKDEHGQLDEDDANLTITLEKGRTAGTPRRPVSVAEEKAQTPPPLETPLELPSPTQLMLPSKSQLDPEVFAGLPTQYRNQIEKKYGQPDLKGSGAGTLEPMPSDVDLTPKTVEKSGSVLSQQGSQNRPRVLPRSTPTTPQKAKIAPSPAQAESLMLPSASQIDPTVLSELPASIRKEIERQTRFRGGQGDGADSAGLSATSTPTKANKRSDATLMTFLQNDARATEKRSHLFRSVSESPTKRRIINKLMSGGGVYLAPDQPVVDRDAILAIDPSKISTEELESLGIDADVFRALPIELQRETFRHHSEQRKSEKARFKAGKMNTFEELAMAEQRRRATIRAAQTELLAQKQLEARLWAHTNDGGGTSKPNWNQQRKPKKSLVEEHIIVDEEEAKQHPPSFLVAQPRRRRPGPSSQIFVASEPTIQDLPSIRGLTQTADIKNLIEQWVHAFAKHGPRQGDIDRVAEYLALVVRFSTTNVEDLDKAASLVDWIRINVSQKVSSSTAKALWQGATESIVERVQAGAKQVYGSELDLHSR